MRDLLRGHGPEYLMEAAALGLFMVSACVFGTLLEHPASPARVALPDPNARRLVMGALMGLTAIAIIHSPWGRRSGAHMNPAVTLALTRLGRVSPRDAAWYVVAHFVGGIAGVGVSALALGTALGHPAVRYVATVPGAAGPWAAFAAEAAISFVLMFAVLGIMNGRHARWTGVVAGALVALWIAIEAPLSGMSMNPARTFASALFAGEWTAWWIYMTAPVLGMLVATQVHLARASSAGARAGCARLHPAPGVRCIFCSARSRRSDPAGTFAREAAFGCAESPSSTHHSQEEFMTSRRLILAVAGLAVLAAGWYAFRPERLWINQSVSESLEELTPAASAGVEHPAPAAGSPVILAAGAFHDGSHETRGTASIYQVGGRRVLRLSGFHTSNGPDVRVYLVQAEDATDNAAVTGAHVVDLGALKGNVGDQNYDVPDEVDLGTHRAVTIWCRRFGVNFGTAPLMDQTRSRRMNDPMVTARAPRVLRMGRFHDVSHETRGVATVYRFGDGRRVLRLTEFETSNGPDVQVYLVAADDASDNATVTTSGFIPLAPLKGNVGDQNYELPADVDLDKYRAVTIWCRRFGVNFGTAPLTAPRS